ncbi:MAG TPA: hypothetical protein PKD53_01275 [Chloroflexaceae bacterium]|nr:hypothetical protein [Chloroflexaceae bacterium]
MLRLLAMLLAAVALAAWGAQPAQPAQQRVEPAEIETVTVEILESDPVQVVANIQGYLGNGCMSLGEITQSRSGDTVEVTVPAIHSGAEICTMQLQLIDERVPLEGPFAQGEYTLIVNGVETSFSV